MSTYGAKGLMPRFLRQQSRHGILDIGLGSVERLHRRNIYPIVLVLKFKHYKHIRDIIDTHLQSHERLSQKEAKEMFDITNKMEQEYKHLISGTWHSGLCGSGHWGMI